MKRRAALALALGLLAPASLGGCTEADKPADTPKADTTKAASTSAAPATTPADTPR